MRKAILIASGVVIIGILGYKVATHLNSLRIFSK